MAAVSQPSDADIEVMFEQSGAFVKVCSPAFEAAEPTEEQEAFGAMCAAFVHGAASARMIASTYEVEGVQVCAQPASARAVLNKAFSLYRSSDDFRALTPAALLLVAQARVAPCETPTP